LGLQYGIVKENITSMGINLDSLVSGAILMLGEEVELKISKECIPCSRMDEIRPGLQDALKGRRGTLASVIKGGLVTIGDKIRQI
jgi:MOSC domain-containing protein YiiM